MPCGRALESKSRGPTCMSHDVSLSKEARKLLLRPNMTEKLLTGMLNLNTNTQKVEIIYSREMDHKEIPTPKTKDKDGKKVNVQCNRWPLSYLNLTKYMKMCKQHKISTPIKSPSPPPPPHPPCPKNPHCLLVLYSFTVYLRECLV